MPREVRDADVLWGENQGKGGMMGEGEGHQEGEHHIEHHIVHHIEHHHAHLSAPVGAAAPERAASVAECMSWQGRGG